MIAADEDALMCDFAETYHILDMRALPVKQAAALAVGLPSNSRIKLKLSGEETPISTIMMAAIIDRLSLLVWQNSRDGTKGKNRPEMLVESLFRKSETLRDIAVYDSAEEFEKARRKLLGKEE